MGLPPELERIVAHEDQEIGPHQEETKLVDLGTGSGKREVLAVDSGSLILVQFYRFPLYLSF